MNQYLKLDEWCIIEDAFDASNHPSSESIFSIGNGHMGQRANFEESYSGKSLQGSYIAGIYYPDKTRVGWWKNGYPEYFAKVLNSPNWIGIDVEVEGHKLDLAQCDIKDFKRTLNMREGTLRREFTAILPNEVEIKVASTRFVSMANKENGFIRYSVTPINSDATIIFSPYIDGDIKNEDSNYDETFWNIIETEVNSHEAYLISETRKLSFKCAFGMQYKLFVDDIHISPQSEIIDTSFKVGNTISNRTAQNTTFSIEKYCAILNSTNHPPYDLLKNTKKNLKEVLEYSFDDLLKEHIKKWDQIWQNSDITIKGDLAAQQGIRYNIFHLNQTYTGDDDRLNIGPKGFTGEKYGGTTYWDTEAYCIPFFLATAPSYITRKLLIYRYKHLSKAIENAEKLGFKNGAALYPMVTINGEECHNEWEITFEEIHRNGAIAFAIHNYIRHTGDTDYLIQYGLEVLIGIARFWAQRATWSNHKNKYVILGVTGPNEYENNINNNWYTNKLAKWCLEYTEKCISELRENKKIEIDSILSKTKLELNAETTLWKEIAKDLYFPYDLKEKVFLQQDGFLDKELIDVDKLTPKERPINQHWSWDRILRSCFIKQADTLQGFYLFEDEFSPDEIERHFNFYEPKTVHESSLSPCVHSIIAAKIGKVNKAYELYLRTSRLDLDDYNNEVHEGLHITSMAGTWMSIVEGFGGKRVYDQKLYLNPSIPDQWKEYSFKLKFLGNDLQVSVNQEEITIESYSSEPFEVYIYNSLKTITPRGKTIAKLKRQTSSTS